MGDISATEHVTQLILNQQGGFTKSPVKSAYRFGRRGVNMRNRNRRNRRRSNLEKKVFLMNRGLFHKDDESREYIAFCNYKWHRGIVRKEYDCVSRGCQHFRKLYTDGRASAKWKLKKKLRKEFKRLRWTKQMGKDEGMIILISDGRLLRGN